MNEQSKVNLNNISEIKVGPQELYLSTKPELHAQIKDAVSHGIKALEENLQHPAYRQAIKNTGGSVFLRVTVDLVEDQAVIDEAISVQKQLDEAAAAATAQQKAA